MSNKRKYAIKIIVGVIGYLVGLMAMNYLDSAQLQHRLWLVLLPVLPLIYVSFVFVHGITLLDEMKRKIATEAGAFSAIATGFTCFSYLFLRDMGAPEFRPEWAFYLMWVYYGIGTVFSWWRYL